MFNHLHRVLPLLWLLLSYCPPSRAGLVNSTVDDSSMDSRGARIQYFPEDSWNSGSGCPTGGCSLRTRVSVDLDPSQLNQGTWHESTFSNTGGGGVYKNPNRVLNATLSFTGTALYAYCVKANTQATPFGNTDMTFYIDGQEVGSLQEPAPGTSGYVYNVLVFAKTDLSPGLHTFVLSNGHVNGSKSLVILDKIIYSYDDGTSTSTTSFESSPTSSSADSSENSSSTNIAVIVGPAVAIPVVAVLSSLGIYLYLRRRRRSVRSFTGIPIDPALTTYMIDQENGSLARPPSYQESSSSTETSLRDYKH